jgi:hypothetical protein
LPCNIFRCVQPQLVNLFWLLVFVPPLPSLFGVQVEQLHIQQYFWDIEIQVLQLISFWLQKVMWLLLPHLWSLMLYLNILSSQLLFVVALILRRSPICHEVC